MDARPHLTRDVFYTALQSAEAHLRAGLPRLSQLEGAHTVIVYTYGAKGKELALMLRNRGVECLVYDNSEASRQRAISDDFAVTATLDLDLPLIVAAGQNQIEILSGLEREAFSLAEALYALDLIHAYGPARRFTEAVQQDMASLFEVYTQLDARSGAAFLEVLEYRASLDVHRLASRRSVAEMWCPPVEGLNIRSFCDIGAYDGDSLATVKANFPKLTRSFTIEPNPRLAPAIAAVADRHGVANTNYVGAAWSHRTRLSSRQLFSGMFVIEESPDGEIAADTLDALLGGRKYDYIKMDVEGTEKPVLEGAVGAFAQASCVAIAGYHLPRDLTDLPAQVHDLINSARAGDRPQRWHWSFSHYSQVFDDSIFYVWRHLE
jgi:FkbM family methyltransferase